jgi:hypothetical protein
MTTTVTGSAGTSLAAATSVPAPGEFVTSAGLVAALQSPENDIATMKGGSYTTTAARTVGSGGSDTFASGSTATVASGATLTVNGCVKIGSTGREVRRAAAALPHSGTLHNASFLDVATANEFRYDGASPAPNDNYVKLREGTSTAQGGLFAGDWMRFVTGPGAAAGQAYTIYREDGTTQLAELWGAGQWVELEWNGTKWLYVSSSPWVPNGTGIPGNAAYYGDGDLGTNGVVLYTANL